MNANLPLSDYLRRVGEELKSLSLENLVHAYRVNVSVQRSLANFPDRSDEILMRQEHASAYARQALQELKHRGLPSAIGLRADGVFYQSDHDWAETQRQIDEWASAGPKPAVATQPPQDGPLPPKEFRINGKTFQVTAQQYAIITSLWEAEGRKTRRDILITNVWKKPTEAETVKKAIDRLKEVLFKAKIGMDIHTETGYYILK